VRLRVDPQEISRSVDRMVSSIQTNGVSDFQTYV